MASVDKGVINYSAHIEGLRLPRFEAPLDNPYISKVCLWTDERNTLFLDFYLAKFCTKEKAISITEHEANLVASRLCFEFGSPIRELRCIGMTLPVDESCQSFRVLSDLSIRFSVRLEATITPSEARISKFAEQLTQPEGHKDVALRLYWLAATQENSIAKFMLLYHVLLFLAGDKQEQVDSLIRRVYPEVEESISPKHGNKKETVFTRLRNELAHRRKDVDLQKTIDEITRKGGQLTEITKSAILERYKP